MLADLLPRTADNRYPGHRLGLWFFALIPLKIVMGINVMINAPTVAQSADGIPISSLGPSGGRAFFFMFAAWGLCQLIFGLAALVVLLRYRSLVPLAFLALFVEQIGRKLLHLQWPIEHVGTPAGVYINGALLGILAVGLFLSLWRRRSEAGGA